MYSIRTIFFSLNVNAASVFGLPHFGASLFHSEFWSLPYESYIIILWVANASLKPHNSVGKQTWAALKCMLRLNYLSLSLNVNAASVFGLPLFGASLFHPEFWSLLYDSDIILFSCSSAQKHCSHNYFDRQENVSSLCCADKDTELERGTAGGQQCVSVNALQGFLDKSCRIVNEIYTFVILIPSNV